MTMYVITHKTFSYPIPTGYQPLLVGANVNKGSKDYLRDNKGDNISDKNPYYSELTGIYWLWKNCSDKNLGISHYRRYFADYSTYGQMVFTGLIVNNLKPIEQNQLDKYLLQYDWIVSQPMKMVQPTVIEQFCSIHSLEDLKTTKKIIQGIYPEYIEDFNVVMHSHKASFYNMFYTHSGELDSYCKWLFNILFEAEKQIDVSHYDGYQRRLFGFLGERLFNVWLHHRKARVKYLPVYNTTKTSRIDLAKAVKHNILGWH